jgi:hypothetical protein
MIPILGSIAMLGDQHQRLDRCAPSVVSRSRFGSFAMQLPASRKVRSSPPQGDGVVEGAGPALVRPRDLNPLGQGTA